MKLEVSNVEEKADGSATCTLDLDAEGLTFLINIGFVSILKEMIDRHKELVNE